MRARAVPGLLAVLAALLAAPVAAQAWPVGAPATIRPARAADLAPRAHELSEWWVLRALPPRGPGALELIVSRGEATQIELVATRPDRSITISGGGTGGPAGGQRGIRHHRELSRLDLTRRGSAMRVRLSSSVESAAGSAELRLRGIRGGAAALGWRLGRMQRFSAGNPRRQVTLSWTAPVADARLTGTVRARDKLLRLRGWRASVEHGWGWFEPGDEVYRYAELAVLHGPRGSAWQLAGVDRVDHLVGLATPDAQWTGVLARVDRRGVELCRPRIDRRRWGVVVGNDWPYAGVARARCAGLDVTIRDARGLGAGVFTAPDVEQLAPFATAGRARGFATHVSP
jgi:hypothetical protein